jgi:hypothetical protein
MKDECMVEAKNGTGPEVSKEAKRIWRRAGRDVQRRLLVLLRTLHLLYRKTLCARARQNTPHTAFSETLAIRSCDSAV